MKKLLLTTTIVALLLAACQSEKTVSVTDVTLNQTTATLMAGSSLILTATVLPIDATNKTVSWSSSNPSVAVVSNGIVTALTSGTTFIIAVTQDGNKTATCAVTVSSGTYVPVTGITLSQTSATLAVGNSLTLTANVLPSNATIKDVSWSSSNTGVATVSNGTVTAKSNGTTTITATTQDGNKSATCLVTVTTGNPPVDVSGCDNTSTPGWGASLGTVSFVSNQTWTFGSQTWSDAVQATNCNKASYSGGSLSSPRSDCRNNPLGNGDLFSWCAIARYKNTLCPSPWRVPDVNDFVNLDKALGGTGNNSQYNTTLVNNYLNNWGGDLGGGCDNNGSMSGQGSAGYYWSLSEYTSERSYSLNIYNAGTGSIYVSPQGSSQKILGSTLRCVK